MDTILRPDSCLGHGSHLGTNARLQAGGDRENEDAQIPICFYFGDHHVLPHGPRH